MNEKSTDVSGGKEIEIKYDEEWVTGYEVRKLRALCDQLARLNSHRNKVIDKIDALFELGGISIHELLEDESDMHSDNALEILQSVIDGRTVWLIDGTIENLKERKRELGFRSKE